MIEPFPDHRGRRRRRNGENDQVAPAASSAGEFVMYVMDADAKHCYGVYYDVAQGSDPTVYVNAITAQRTLL
jgi:hypothetical protein